MSIDYSIKAYPTLFKGVRYRSRLEARWAAFFDELQWAHTYEPYDLGEWSPDFLVNVSSGDTPDNRHSFLVEVKPIEECHQETIERIERACESREDLWSGDEPKVNGVILTRVAPLITKYESHGYSKDQAQVGWYVSSSLRTHPVTIGWQMQFDNPKTYADLIYSARDGFFTAGGDGGFAGEGRFSLYPSYTMGLWSAACNAVQWRGKDA